VIAVATVQEEISFAGAYTAAFGNRPDIAIAVDVTFAKSPAAVIIGHVNLERVPHWVGVQTFIRQFSTG